MKEQDLCMAFFAVHGFFYEKEKCAVDYYGNDLTEVLRELETTEQGLTEEEAAKFIARWRIKSAEEIEEWISIASDYCDLMIKNRFGTANPFKNLNLQKITEAGV